MDDDVAYVLFGQLRQAALSGEEENLMKMSHARVRGCGVSWVLFLLAFGVLSMSTLPAKAQQAEFPGEIVDAGELPPIRSGPYRIQVGDVLDISFFKTVDLDETRVVGPDGEIYLPIVGRVDVVGRTVDDITKEITEGYAQEMINPQITVSVEEYSGLQVYVSGEVNRPGIQEYRGGLTLVQAISDAGGFNNRARMREVLLIRPGPENTPIGTIIDVKEILRKGQISNDVPLAPLDIVYVHHKKIVNLNLFVEQYISNNLPRFGPWMWYLPGYQDRTTNGG